MHLKGNNVTCERNSQRKLNLKKKSRNFKNINVKIGECIQAIFLANISGILANAYK
jgi:hypothetical protein